MKPTRFSGRRRVFVRLLSRTTLRGAASSLRSGICANGCDFFGRQPPANPAAVEKRSPEAVRSYRRRLRVLHGMLLRLCAVSPRLIPHSLRLEVSLSVGRRAREVRTRGKVKRAPLRRRRVNNGGAKMADVKFIALVFTQVEICRTHNTEGLSDPLERNAAIFLLYISGLIPFFVSFHFSVTCGAVRPRSFSPDYSANALSGL